MSKPHKKTPHADHSYSKITEHLYLGFNMACCDLHFKNLKSLGVVADINVEAENIERPHNMEVALWLPTPEHEVPSQTQLLVGANSILNLISKKKTVYVHCENGHARSAVVVGAYLILTGMSTNEALQLMKEKRSVIHPGELHVKALMDFESSLS